MINLLADFTVRFNISTKKHPEFFYVPYSNLNAKVAEILLKYNSINSFSIDLCPVNKKFRIKIRPIYLPGDPLIRGIELVSKPGLRVY